MTPENKSLLKNTLIAQALGDAFGYIVEFDSWESIKAEQGPNGIQYEPRKLALYASDDTQMTLFCLEGLLKAQQIANDSGVRLKDPTVEIYKSYLDWFRTQSERYSNDADSQKSFDDLFKKTASGKQSILTFKELFNRRAPGGTCLSALGSGRMGTVESPINDSKGCGGIMRTIPVAFFSSSTKEAFDWGVKQAATTHGHKEGYLSSGVYSAIAYELIHNTTNLSVATSKAVEILQEYPNSEFMMEVMNKTSWAINHMQGLQNNALTKELGEGWVGEEALAVALYCAATSITFKEVLEKSANHRGDSDSTAMLAAGLWYLMTRDESFVKDARYLDLNDCINFITL